MKAIKLTVDSDMCLTLEPTCAGYEGERNAAAFVISQPDELWVYECHAEVRCGNGKTRHPIYGGLLPLSGELTCRGWHSIQLIYSENGYLVRKTGLAGYYIRGSVNAPEGDFPPPPVMGVAAPLAGFFTMYVDEGGDLFAIAPKGGRVPLEFDAETGDLYYLIKRMV